MKLWRARYICCGREDGAEYFDTWDKAEQFRESYTSGPAVALHGYSARDSEPGHRRAVIVDCLVLDEIEEEKP